MTTKLILPAKSIGIHAMNAKQRYQRKSKIEKLTMINLALQGKLKTLENKEFDTHVAKEIKRLNDLIDTLVPVQVEG